MIPARFLLCKLLFAIKHGFLVDTAALATLSTTAFRIVVVSATDNFLRANLRLSSAMTGTSAGTATLVATTTLQRRIFARDNVVVQAVLLRSVTCVNARYGTIFSRETIRARAVMVVSQSLALRTSMEDASSNVRANACLR